MEFIVVRHAEPEVVSSETGTADPALTPRGLAQAEALARCPGLGHLDAIVQSPARRAIETAAPISAVRGLTPVTVPGLAEYDWGNAREYVPVEVMRTERDPRYLAWALTGDPGGGIDVPAFRTRVLATFADLAAANPGRRRILAVCHGGVLNALLGDVLGQEKLFWFHAAYTSFSRVAVARDGRRGILSLNETPHLFEVDELSLTR